MSLRRSERIARKNANNDGIIISNPAAMSSRNSHVSSTVSQQRLLQARAARELAELEQLEIAIKRKEIEAKKNLIQARLEEDLASIHSRSSSRSEKATELWVDSSRPYFGEPVDVQKEIETPQDNQPTHYDKHDEPFNDVDCNGARAGCSGAEDEQHFKDSDVANLMGSLTKNFAQSHCNNDKLLGRLTSNNLPMFSGDALDWLRFKNAYEITTRVGRYSEEENLGRLQRCLQGKAWEAVAARLIATTSASDVMRILEMRFGRPDLVLGRLIAEMRRVPKLNGMRSEVVLLATKVDNCVAAIESAGNIGYLYSPELISDILNKLTEPLFYRWLDYSKNARKSQPQLTLLAKYLMSEAQEICKRGTIESPSLNKTTKIGFSSFKPFPVVTNMVGEETPSDDVLLTRDGTMHQAINVVSTAKKDEIGCVFCSEVSHMIKACPKFKAEHIDKRWEWIVTRKLCFRCLSSTHRRDRCKSKKRCSTCQMSGHHTLLHKDKPMTSATSVEIASDNNQTAANVWSAQRRKVYLKVIPVCIDGPTGSVSTFALLDEGSTVTLVENEVADKIGAQGPETDLTLHGAVGSSNDMPSRMVALTIRTGDGSHQLNRVRTVEILSVPQFVVTDEQLSYDHLKGIPLEAYHGKPSILIGQDNWHLIVSRELREGRKNEPVASRTLLGWVLHGFSSSTTENIFQVSCHVDIRKDDLHDLMQDYFRLDSIGIKYKDNRRYSPDEQRAIAILDAKSEKIGDRWHTGLIWRTDDVRFPNNIRNAEHRLRLIEKMMDSDASFAADYGKQIQNMLDKNYAEEVLDTPSGRVWYLPHFGVRNPNKPGKLRLVHDAKAETKGVSLNTELLAGPDLLNSLLGVLLRFRQRPVAITGDIREMFMQIKILKEDQNAQCFLWRGMDRKNIPRTYRMTSMIFGAKSSPCTATYILRRNAKQFIETHPRAVEAIHKRHYVDDYLDSVDTEEEAKQLVQDVIMIHKAGGFDIRGWASNKPTVLPQEADKISVSLLGTANDVERTLGLNWKPAADTLGFDLNLKKVSKEVVDGTRKPTKREILKVVMSVFDPLGLLSPFIIRGKILLQYLWRSGKSWDQEIDDGTAKLWFAWIGQLKKLEDFSVPRCYGFRSQDNLQLHVFVDASEEAYSCVVYLRSNIQVVFVAAKCRVAPLKAATIPRLELQAALLGARLAHTVVNEQTLVINKRFFWTDSKTVWYWINKNPRKNKVFVSNRLSEIDELTKSQEWRWVPGLLNVADEATRVKENISGKWLSGPEFLGLPEEHWPQMEPDLVVEEDVEEVLLVDECQSVRKLILDERFSNWRRLVRSMAWAILYIDKFHLKRNVDLLITPDYEKRAEIMILKQAQAEMFKDDISALRKRDDLKPSSKLIKMNPEINDDGVIIARSRLDSGRDLPPSLKSPILLDAKHNITKLIIKYYHIKLGHNYIETLYNELRQCYYIFRLRTTVRSMISKCVTCRRRRSRPVQPMMAALPEMRLHHHCRPFTYCGIDLFGPMTVAIGRRHEKRWGVIFTCFGTRAVHIELASSLSTDSTLLAIRRMAARRGFPKQIHSDNGTNFRSADKELRKAVENTLSGIDLARQANDIGVKWTFNPPDAAHMGGVWERLVRSIKTALSATLMTTSPKEEVLLTLLIEAENIVNSRPLTHVSLDIDQEEALTPNHFLIGASNPLPRPGEFSDDDLHLRRQWRLAQRLADKFWSRWLREYLPSLQVRHRWKSDAGVGVRLGDLVLIADSNSPRNIWPRGRVVAVKPGHDGRVRIAEVATKGGILRRPVNKLILLLSQPPLE